MSSHFEPAASTVHREAETKRSGESLKTPRSSNCAAPANVHCAEGTIFSGRTLGVLLIIAGIASIAFATLPFFGILLTGKLAVAAGLTGETAVLINFIVSLVLFKTGTDLIINGCRIASEENLRREIVNLVFGPANLNPPAYT